MKQITKVISLVIGVIVLAGCAAESSPVSTTQIIPSLVLVTENPYPAPGLTPYPSNRVALPTRATYIFKTSEPGKVTIHGELLAADPENLPDPNDAIFLVVVPDDQVTTIPSFITDGAVQADVNEATGEFVFSNIKPGFYAIVVKTVTNAQIPARREDGGFVILRIKEDDRDQTIDVGYIRIP